MFIIWGRFKLWMWIHEALPIKKINHKKHKQMIHEILLPIQSEIKKKKRRITIIEKRANTFHDTPCKQMM